MTSPTRRGFLYGLTITSGVASGCSAARTVTAQGTSIGDSRMDQYDTANTGSRASTATSAGTTARNTEDSEETTSGDESTGTDPDDDGIPGDIMNDFDELSNFESE